jgi:hypothetical protein
MRNLGGHDSTQSSNSDPITGGVPEQPQINDRLQLLKSTFKYKNSNIDGSIGSGGSGNFYKQIEDSGSVQHEGGRRRTEAIEPPTDYVQRQNSLNAYEMGTDGRNGPVRAMHIKVSED